MKKSRLWVLAAALSICGITMLSCDSGTKKSTAVSATDDPASGDAPSRLQALRHRVVALHAEGRAFP